MSDQFRALRKRLIDQIARLEKTLEAVRSQLAAVDAILDPPNQTTIPGVVPPGMAHPKK